MSKKDGLDIGDRMKRFESVTELHLPRRIPVIVRVDGRAFHTFAKNSFGKRWSSEFVESMIAVAKAVISDIQGCNFCYCQSDEISFLLTDYKTVKSEAWFGYDLRKVVSISAAMASAVFSRLCGQNVCFDSRAFSIPKDEVTNYFVWRQIDAIRNAVSMAVREYYTQKELNNRSCKDMQDLLLQKGINFDDYPTIRKRGFCIIEKDVDFNIPIFTTNRSYIERFVNIRED